MRHLLGLHITRCLPRGFDLLADLRAAVPSWRPTCVLDVGANVGQSSAVYLRAFPQARVHAFEPELENYAQLIQRVRHPRLTTWPIALSDHAGGGHLIGEGVFARLEPGGPVPTLTLDGFAGSEGLERIHFLKIDTEGHDLHVLQGGDALLRAHRVDVVQVEAGINPGNGTHVPLGQFAAYLVDRSYLPFGFYGQTPEFAPPGPALRRLDAVFIRSGLR